MVSHYDKKKSVAAGLPKEWEPLTLKQELFVKEYLIDLNVSQAANRSGISRQAADMLLKHPKVVEAVRIEMRTRAVRAGVKADRVLEELYYVATSDMTEVFKQGKDGGLVLRELSDIPEELRKVIKSVEHQPLLNSEGLFTGHYRTKVHFHDKIRALELLGKHLNIFAENAANNSEGVNPLIAALNNAVTQAWRLPD